MLFSSDYIEYDVKKKDKAWIGRLITEFRTNSYKPLYDPAKAEKNRKIINSDDSLENIKLMFKDPKKLEKAGFEFIPIAIIEKIKNLLFGEQCKAEIKASVDMQDPTMEYLRKEDINLLKSKTKIEKAVNKLKASIGLPPEKIGNEHFNGNYDDFQAMGFDENDPGDVDSFSESVYQLDFEILFQKIINRTFTANSITDYTYDWLNDALATKTAAWQEFINKLTGEIVIRRIVPEQLWVVKGNSKINQKSDIALGFYELMTVSEFLKRAGDNFDIVKEFNDVLTGVNHKQGTQYTGIRMGDTILGTTNNVCEWSSIQSMKVEIGYTCFKSIDSDQYKEFTNKLGNTKVYEIDTTIDNDKGYKKVELFQERTYEAYYIVTGRYEQIVYAGGLVYHGETEGEEDEFANYPLKYIQYEGKTLAEVAYPWIVLAQESFTKFRYLVRKAKEDGRSYNLESLKAVAKAFNVKDGDAAGLIEVYEKMEDSVNELYSFPIDDQGKMIQMQGGVNFDRKNDFDTKVTSFKQIIEWAVQMIKNDIGINDLREGANQKTNDVYKLQAAALETSSNATYYVNSIFDNIYTTSGTTILALSLDILRYKDTLPYKWLTGVVGVDGMEKLASLPKLSAHRMDIFVTSFATVQERIRVLQATANALANGQITYADSVLIDNINDHRKAQKLLVIKEQKAIKLKKQEQEQAQANLMALQKQKTQDELMIINAKGKVDLQGKQVLADGYVKAAQIQVAGKGQVQSQKDRAEQDQQILENNLKEQKAYQANV